ncbi:MULTISPECIES: DUF3253 domain-containing protein [unclassified Caulobacter]|jgi:hypothetical protein|uniref:DUF3253 domain-containing protein n=1 Tax=unclassified Caulobacter TaxID=2648921 RepID=UPI0006FE7D07|nr:MULTISPECIES: DUF3253 domain-containing protein [unclassified Caulobacter]KQV58279.1 hypothetical protein ASC62_05600 [Caulobacter sp. Root342]KQV69216.1 hypothetical protein ASC70_10435 [Caulobacter sp. Root343]
MSSPIQDIILSQLAALPEGKSIDPMNVAKAMQPERWQQILGHVRTNAIELARDGKVVILRHNKPVNPEKFRGVYRIRLRMEGDPTSFEETAGEDQIGGDED